MKKSKEYKVTREFSPIEFNYYVTDRYIDSVIDSYIDILVEWLIKSDTRFIIKKIQEKNEDYLRRWLAVRKQVLKNQKGDKYEKSKNDKKRNKKI